MFIFGLCESKGKKCTSINLSMVAFHSFSIYAGACSEKVSDADHAVKLLEGDLLEQAAGEDWRPGEWEGLGGPNAKLGLAEENEESQGECTVPLMFLRHQE